MNTPKKISRRTHLLWLMLAPAACDSAARPEAPNSVAPATTLSPSGSSSGYAAPAMSSEPSADLPPPPAPTAAKSLAQAMNGFGLEVFRDVSGAKPGNLALSPLSLSTALTMTWGGAAGATAAEMQKALRLAGTPAEVMKQVGGLSADLTKPDAQVTVRLANRLFGEKSYKFEAAYLEQTRAAFGAPLEPLDFVGAPGPARDRINGWVAEQTNDRIKNLVPASAIDKETRLVLTNAVYFLGDWQEPFTKETTRDEKFQLSASESKSVPTMHRGGGMRYTETADYKALELPYKGGDFSMLLIAPEAVDGLSALVSKLDDAKLDGIVGALKGETVSVSLPKFEIDPAEALALAEPLQKLGMTQAFDREKADFSGIAKPKNPADRLFIGNVFHKAFVRVDEKGTEAAAATAVVMPRAGSAPPEKVYEFRADRPFLFVIRHNQSGLAMFLGTVVDPTAKG